MLSRPLESGLLFCVCVVVVVIDDSTHSRPIRFEQQWEDEMDLE